MALGTHLSALFAAWSISSNVSALPSPSPSPHPHPQTLSTTNPPAALTTSALYGAPPNDFTCVSTHNPVVVLHGLSSNRDVDLHLLQHALNARGYCTYSLNYGAHAAAPWIGGVRDMRDTARDIADFILKVRTETGVSRVDIVGHSEGAVQALYVPLTQPGLADAVERVVAVSPAVHGATYFGFTDLWYIGGDVTRGFVGGLIDLLGCPACEQLAPDGLVTEQFAAAAAAVKGGGKGIAQEGNKVTVIYSEADTLVPPHVSIIDEEAVRNVRVQDTCPEDNVGHAGLAWDKSVWRLVVNALEETDEEVFPCEKGLPL